MKVSYFPGCTLKTRAKELDVRARKSAEALGVTLEKFVFFVAYRDYARAQELLEALLAPDDHAADADFADEDEESEDEDE